MREFTVVHLGCSFVSIRIGLEHIAVMFRFFLLPLLCKVDEISPVDFHEKRC